MNNNMKKFEKTIRGGGRVEGCDVIPNGISVKVARDFLVKLVEQMCRQAREYHRLDGDHFLRYPERMMYSQFAAAIQTLTPFHVSENSIKRASEGGSSAGRVDFWAYYRKTNILLELKRQAMKIEDGVQTQRVAKGLDTLVNQTKSLREEATGWGVKSALIGLDIILPYSQRTGVGRIKSAFGNVDRIGLCSAFRKDVLAHGSKPNFVATWLPPDSMTQFPTEKPDKCEFTPFIGFVAYVVAIG